MEFSLLSFVLEKLVTVRCRTCLNCLVTVECVVPHVLQCFCLDTAFVTGLYQFHLWKKTLSSSAVQIRRVVAMLNSLQTNGYMFLSFVLRSKWSRLVIDLFYIGIVLRNCMESCYCSCRSSGSIEKWSAMSYISV